jgi:hypothetical protein
VLSRSVRISVGVTLLALGLWGTIYSIQVSRAHCGYYALKYGSLSSAPQDAAAQQCEDVFALYPHNYFLSHYAIERLWPDQSNPASNNDFAPVEQWCERGLAQNYYHWYPRQVKAMLLARESENAAAEYWSQFVEWQFWSPRNLEFLIECYANAGRLAEASEILSILEGQKGYGRAKAILQKAWAREMQAR